MSAMKVSMRSSVAARPASRSAVVVRASAESRRSVLSGFVAGASLLAVSSAQAVSNVDVFDDRKVQSKGFDLIYEARELDLPQNVRDGLTQARGNIEATRKRIAESEARIDSALEPSIKKAYWTEAREELRRQVGTLRFDLNTLASAKPKEERKKALALKKDFIAQVEALDYALRSKNQDTALSKLSSTKSALDSVIASL